MAEGRTIEDLEGGTRGKGTARGIGVVERGEDSFLGKLPFKGIGVRDLVTRTGIGGAMCSKDTVREEGIERDGNKREERILEIEGTKSDTEIVTELGGRDGEIETTMESTKIEKGRVDEGARG